MQFHLAPNTEEGLCICLKEWILPNWVLLNDLTYLTFLVLAGRAALFSLEFRQRHWGFVLERALHGEVWVAAGRGAEGTLQGLRPFHPLEPGHQGLQRQSPLSYIGCRSSLLGFHEQQHITLPNCVRLSHHQRFPSSSFPHLLNVFWKVHTRASVPWISTWAWKLKFPNK